MILRALRFSGFSLVFGVVACSLLVDTSEIDAGCGPGTKFCAEQCVSIDEPFYGCEASGCQRCPGDHVVTRCNDGECEDVSCALGWGCTGCTASLFTDPTNCGHCGNVCKTGETCSAGICMLPDSGAGGAP
jgi:hypothetical protein